MPQNDWNTNAGKREIVWAIFRKLRENNEALVPEFLDCNNTKAMTPTLGNTTVPNNVKVYALPKGDRLLGAGCSLILEIPPSAVPDNSEQILTYACTYTLWSHPVVHAELANLGAGAILWGGAQMGAQGNE
jgi:hypothetical protein